MYSVCYFGSDPNQDRDFRKISEQTPNINFRENLHVVESLWYVHSERHDEATSFFFPLGKVSEKNTKRQPIFILLVSFGIQTLAMLLSYRSLSSPSKLVTDVACGTDSHTWQERRKVEEIQEEQERGWGEMKETKE